MKDAKDQLIEMRQGIANASMCFEQMVEAYHLSAKLMRARYDSLVEEGFTEPQALEIIKARGLD
jgi:hypothetical protein